MHCSHVLHYPTPPGDGWHVAGRSSFDAALSLHLDAVIVRLEATPPGREHARLQREKYWLEEATLSPILAEWRA